MRRSLLSFTLIASLAASAAAQNKMFVTLESDTAKLGDWTEAGTAEGLAAANAICAALASGAGLTNATAYRAWISDATTDAWCNVAGFSGKKIDQCGEDSLPDAGPWVRVDGKPFAFSLTALIDDDEVFYVGNLDQHGNPIVSGFSGTRTATSADGVWTGKGTDCDGWTNETTGNSPGGELNAGTSSFTSWSGYDCSLSVRLLCFESGTGSPLAPFGALGSYVFVTSNWGFGDLDQWDDANGQNGIAAGDEICREAARRGRLPAPGSYVAWLSDSTTDAIDRLTLTGPWRRPDGPQIAANKAELAQIPHAAAIEVDELGNHFHNYAWTGTATSGTVDSDHCGDWQDTLQDGKVGLSDAAGIFWTTGSISDCDNVAHLYCFSNVRVLFADGFEKHGTFYWSAEAP